VDSITRGSSSLSTSLTEHYRREISTGSITDGRSRRARSPTGDLDGLDHRREISTGSITDGNLDGLDHRREISTGSITGSGVGVRFVFRV
jgi:hypothetical protein